MDGEDRSSLPRSGSFADQGNAVFDQKSGLVARGQVPRRNLGDHAAPAVVGEEREDQADGSDPHQDPADDVDVDPADGSGDREGENRPYGKHEE